MRKTLGLAAVVGLTALVIHTGWGWSSAQAQAVVALTGRVNSEQEGPMEGVVVTARKSGSTAAISVVSDDTGRYSFPAAKLEPGEYALRIRAIGYELPGRTAIDVRPGVTANADLTLRPTKQSRLATHQR